MLLGLKKPRISTMKTTTNEILTDVTEPVDWLKKGAVTPVKN